MSSHPTYSVTLPYKVRCGIPECGKPINHVFKKELDGIMINFCSPYHARLGEDRWMEKKDQGITPGMPPKPKDEEFISDNTDEMIE